MAYSFLILVYGKQQTVESCMYLGVKNYGALYKNPKKIDPFTMSYSGGFFGILETLGTLRTLPAHSQDRAMSVVVTPLVTLVL